MTEGPAEEPLPTEPCDQQEELTPAAERSWFRTWVICLALFFIVVGGVAAIQQAISRSQHKAEVRALMDASLPDPGVTSAEDTETATALPVKVGFYVERIQDLSVKDAAWTAVFNVWFHWQGGSFRPGEDFVILGASVENKEKLDERHEGEDHYERYLVTARVSKAFGITQFPADTHLLLLTLESGSQVRQKVLFVPDTESTSISSRVKVPGYDLSHWKILEKPHSYKTTRGDPRLAPGTKSTYSQIRLGLTLQRSGWGLFFKMFQALYIAVFIAFLACFIKPVDLDPRFGLGVGALFAAVANSYIVGEQVPDTGELALADTINAMGIFTILITLVESTVSLHLYDRRQEPALSRTLDLASFKIMLGGFVLANALVLLAAVL
jgi:hypothetical protein